MKKYIYTSLFLFAVLLLVGCRGSQQSKLIGTWEQIAFTKPVVGDKTEWVFYVTNEIDIIVSKQQDTGVVVTTTKYRYDIDGSAFSIYNFDDDYSGYTTALGLIEGEYWIDVLDKTNCKVTKTKHPETADLEDPESSIFLRIELVKRD
ncbi:MAG: hypothetical protein JEZ09_04985 [Salinivirgaceae bacterium]|nr:hypothetical protein [Salinivirgaceae bacterium]